MAEAYLVLPAFILLYFFTAPRPWRTRFWHLVLAGGVLLVVSLCWIVAVDLVPAAHRPYVGSSGNDTELQLAFGYNGISRVFGPHLPFLSSRSSGAFHTTPIRDHPPKPTPPLHGAPPARGGLAGFPGPTRLLNKEVGGQISWLLPLALAGLVALLWRRRSRWVQEKHFQAAMLWGGWFLTCALFFSFTSTFQMYYMVVFAPAICALGGIGVSLLWQEYRNSDIRGCGLPVAVCLTALEQLSLLFPFPAWRQSVLTPLLFATLFVVGLGLLVLRLWRRDTVFFVSKRFVATGLLIAGLVTFQIAPAIWATLPVIQNRNSAFPVAGPYGSTIPSLGSTYRLTSSSAPASAAAANILTPTDLLLVHFLDEQKGKSRFLYATTSSNYADLVIIQTGKAVMAMGGFAGADRILTTAVLTSLVEHHTVRYFLFPGTIPVVLGGINDWVKSACLHMPFSTWDANAVFPAGTRIAGLRLYDCNDPHPVVKHRPVFHRSHQRHMSIHHALPVHTLSLSKKGDPLAD